jgi:hypothetical protein
MVPATSHCSQLTKAVEGPEMGQRRWCSDGKYRDASIRHFGDLVKTVEIVEIGLSQAFDLSDRTQRSFRPEVAWALLVG